MTDHDALIEVDEREAGRRLRARNARNAAFRAILIPTLISLLYYLLIAPAEYESRMEFTIQGTSAPAPDLLSNLGFPANSGASSDGRLMVDYVRSAEMVELLRRRYGFSEAYGGFTLDPLSHLRTHAPIERAVDFWRGRSKISYDASSNVIEVSVSAYRPADAKRLADGVLAGANAMLTALDNETKSASGRFATQQLAEQKRQFDEVKRRVASIRGTEAMTLDAQAQRAVQSISTIDGELAKLRVDAATAQATYRPDAPQARAVQTQIASLERARAQAIAAAQHGPGTAVASGDIAARTALLDYEFAQKSYYAALQAYQAANGEAGGNHRYIVAFIPPRLPERSTYFPRLWNVLAIAAASALLVGTAMLTYSVVKDHMQ